MNCVEIQFSSPTSNTASLLDVLSYILLQLVFLHLCTYMLILQ